MLLMIFDANDDDVVDADDVGSGVDNVDGDGNDVDVDDDDAGDTDD